MTLLQSLGEGGPEGRETSHKYSGAWLCGELSLGPSCLERTPMLGVSAPGQREGVRERERERVRILTPFQPHLGLAETIPGALLSSHMCCRIYLRD